MSARRYEISDSQWERMKDMIPRAKTGRPPKDDRISCFQEDRSRMVLPQLNCCPVCVSRATIFWRIRHAEGILHHSTEAELSGTLGL